MFLTTNKSLKIGSKAKNDKHNKGIKDDCEAGSNIRVGGNNENLSTTIKSHF